MGQWVRRLIQLIAFGGLSACMQYDFRVVIPESTKEVKKVFAAATPTPVDILFVVDNSGSMADEQENLARNFNTFISELTSGKGNDYRIGIVTTDLDSNDAAHGQVERAGLVGTTFSTQSPFHLQTFDSITRCTWTDIPHGCFRGDDPAKRVIPSTSPPAEQIETFKSNVRVGSCGSGREQGLEGMKRGLSNTSPGLCNEGFLRDGANLVVVIVSDEEDATPNPPPVREYVDFLVALKGSASKVRVAAIVGSVNGSAQNCSTTVASCGGICASRPPEGSGNACSGGMSNCPSGESCQMGRCQNEDLRDWASCNWCSFYNAPDCCSAISGSRYVDFALAVERAVNAADPSIAVTQCRGTGTTRVACLIDSICQAEFAETLRRIARDLIVDSTYALNPVAKYPPGVVVEVNHRRLQICSTEGQTDCDYTVAPDGTSVTINRNPPGPEDEVEIYFVIEESDAG